MTARASDAATSHCGHDQAQFVTGDEGTSYCPACESERDDTDQDE